MSGLVDGLRLWAREIIVVLFLAGALEMILPETDVKRFARVALGFFVVLAVGRPILGLVGGGLLFDQNLSGLASWGLGLAPVRGPAGAADDPLELGAALRQGSQERAFTAYRAALESQFAALARRDPQVAEAAAEVALITDSSSPFYGDLLSLRLTVWMAPERNASGQGAESPLSEDGTGRPATAGGTGVTPVVIEVQPVITGGRGIDDEAGGWTEPGGGDPSGGDPSGTPAGELARRLRSEIVLLVGVPPGGVAIEVWPAGR